MRTTLDLPGNLLNEAMEVTHTGTKTAVIVKALEELARKSKITGLKKYKVKLFWILILMKSEIVHNGGFGRHPDLVDYFVGGTDSKNIDFLIDENINVTNEIIFAELIPCLKIKK